ncbi:MAG: Flp pilus assembly protein CpaB [Gammaproteobacteria bacterium]|nr:Flp pilus assembly protein CpaB [Gammaproteobacteria bacterium]
MALSDYFRPDLFRPRNLVPAFIAVAVVAGAWFTIQQTRTDAPPAAPHEQQAEVATQAPPPDTPPEAESQVFPTVLVARRDIGRGVLLNMGLLEWREQTEAVDLSRAVIRDAVPLDSVLGAVTRRAIATGELITWDKLVMSGMPGFVTAVLSPGHRAMTVSVDEATTRAQIIYPGDRVDVILVHSPGSGGVPAAIGGDSGPASQVIVRDVRVLAVGSTTIDMHRYGTTSLAPGGLIQQTEPLSGETYTLEVTILDAERIALATVAGRLTLVVRPVSAVSVAESTAPVTRHDYGGTAPVRFSEVMEGLGAPEEDLLPPALPPASVRIIRGRGRSSRESFDVEQDAGAEEAANLLAEALRGD